MPIRCDTYSVGHYKIDNGALKTSAPITRVGVFAYKTFGGATVRELRLPDEVFKADALASFEVVPITDDHPPGNLTTQNTRDYQRGTVTKPRKDGKFVRADLTITDAELIAAVEKGKRELSCGYKCDIEHTEGVTKGIEGIPDGLRFDVIQRNIQGNHVAVVAKGRAGTEVAMRFDAADAIEQTEITLPSEKTQGNKMEFVTIRIDGIDVKVPAGAEQIIQRALKDTQTKLDAADAQAKESQTTLSKVEARADAAEAKAKELQTRLDAAEAPEKVQAQVRERLALERQAVELLPKDQDVAVMDSEEIKRAVILQATPEAKAQLEAHKDDAVYLQARYDQAVEQSKAAPKPPAHLAMRMAGGGEPRKDSISEARERMRERNRSMSFGAEKVN